MMKRVKVTYKETETSKKSMSVKKSSTKSLSIRTSRKIMGKILYKMLLIVKYKKHPRLANRRKSELALIGILT
jgi:hypothetical protein